MTSLVIYNPHRNLFDCSNQGEREGRGEWHVWGRGEVHTGVVGKSEGKSRLEDLDINRRAILRWHFKK